MSYIEKRIARKTAQNPDYRAAFQEEEELLAQELQRRQQVMTAIAELRKAQRLSQQQLAERLKVSQARVSQMEQGKEPLSIDSVLQMVDVLNGGIVILSPDEIADFGLENRLVSRGETIGKKVVESAKRSRPGKTESQKAPKSGKAIEKASRA